MIGNLPALRMTDIVEQLKNDRENGAKRLVSEYKAGLLTLARRLYDDPSDAEELVNRTFAAVVDGIDDFLEQSSFFTWMCQILVNLHANDTRRKSNANETYPGELPEIADASAEGEVYRVLDASLLHDAIETLPKDIRKTLVMHYFMDFSVKEVARLLAVPVGTVKRRLYYARQILAVKLGAKMEEAKEAAKKPGVKAALAALALCAITAAGATVIAAVHGGAQNTGGPSFRATASGENGETGGSSPVATLATSYTRHPTFDGENQIQNPTQTSDDSTIRRSGDLTINLSSEEPTMNTTTRTAALGAATALALASAPPAATADGQFFMSGWPVADPSYPAASGATSLTVAPLHDTASPDALEARYCTSAASAATSLRSDEYGGFTIIVK